MSIEIKWEPEAELRFRSQFDEKVRDKVVESLEKVREEGLVSHPDVKGIEHPELGWLFRLKVKEEGRGGEVDHRVFFDYSDGDILV
ncbi:MAG: hypothetical protein ABEJ62_02000, partial [Candidatus Nanohaloarchaea archaeon]